MRIRVIDFEATDDDKAKASGRPVGICEFGYTDVVIGPLGSLRIEPTVSSLINPNVPMSIEALAVHHITPSELEGAPPPDYAVRSLMGGLESRDMFAAHNAEFERLFFAGGSHRWICTYRSARLLLPDVPRHSNQYLRYHLGVDKNFHDPTAAMPPHRAGPDSYVTAHILVELLRMADPERLASITSDPILLETVPFGQNKGKPWSVVNRSYLEWVINQDFDRDIKHTARHWLNK